eukprot:scaffold6412_cov153-Isochrysis_galbana.AAC.3
MSAPSWPLWSRLCPATSQPSALVPTGSGANSRISSHPEVLHEVGRAEPPRADAHNTKHCTHSGMVVGRPGATQTAAGACVGCLVG